MNLYELLGVSSNASKEEIKQAYKSLVKKYHPDVNKNVDINIIKNLNEAKEILLDGARRREYDLKLDELNKAKEFSKDKSETYIYKKEEYKEEYVGAYVTRWDFLKSYFKNSVDNVFKKVLKGLLVSVNYLFFLFIKLVCYLFIYACYLFQELIDFIAGLFGILSLLCLFGIAKNYGVSLFSFMPVNIQYFCFYLFIAALIEFIKLFVLSGTVNIFRFIQKIHDKLFIFILVKL